MRKDDAQEAAREAKKGKEAARRERKRARDNI